MCNKLVHYTIEGRTTFDWSPDYTYTKRVQTTPMVLIEIFIKPIREVDPIFHDVSKHFKSYLFLKT